MEYGDFTWEFRHELSEFLGRQDSSRRRSPDPGHLFLTAGVSQALDMLSTMCAGHRQGDVVLVESPTYFLAPAIFRDHGLEVVGVDTDSDGMVIQSLLDELQKLQLRGRRAAMLYTIPVHHNPTGRTMPAERREAIVGLARDHEILVIADEVYTLLTYGASPPTTMASLGENVLSLGSFSKILAPGLRVGWIEGSPEQLKRLSKWGVIDSGGHLSHFASCVVAAAMKSRALDSHLEQLRKNFQERCWSLVGSLKSMLPEDCTVTNPHGGYFVWVKLPQHVDAREIASRSEEFGFLAKPGHLFTLDACSEDSFLRLCFARLQPAQLAEGARRLAAAIQHTIDRQREVPEKSVTCAIAETATVVRCRESHFLR